MTSDAAGQHHGPAGHHNEVGRAPHRAEGDGLNRMAASATLHCLTGCALGEILGLVIGASLGLANLWTIALAIGLAFLFGYALSTLPLIKAGLGLGAALAVVLAADTLSIATMEVVDNAVMAVVPGAMDAGLINAEFWIGMMIALTAAYVAAYPVNRYLLRRGKGHALTHEYHCVGHNAEGARRLIPDLSPVMLAAILASFLIGGLTVAVSAEVEAGGRSAPAQPDSHPH